MILIVTKGRTAEKAFSGLETRTWKPEELDTAISECGPGDALYLDAAAFTKPGFTVALSALFKNSRVTWGVVDLKGSLHDPAALFHAGASDYLGSFALGAPVDSARMEGVLELGTRVVMKERKTAYTTSPERRFPGWSSVKEGKEYELLFLYVGLADPESIRKKAGEPRFNRLKEDFLAMIAPSVSDAGGRIWMGDGQSALSVFPPTAGEIVISLCLRLLLNRAIIVYEQLKLEIPVNFHIALHKGNTVWMEPGKTGTVVAEAVNFIYHLGRKFSREGTIAISGDAIQCIPGRLLYEFEDHGLFECKKTLVFSGFDAPSEHSSGKQRTDASPKPKGGGTSKR